MNNIEFVVSVILILEIIETSYWIKFGLNQNV